MATTQPLDSTRVDSTRAPVPFVENSERTIANLTAELTRTQGDINSRWSGLPFMTAVSVTIIAGFFFASIMPVVAAVFLGIASFIASYAVINAIVDKIRLGRTFKVITALADPNFAKFANANEITLNRETVFYAYKAFMKHTQKQIASSVRN